MGSRLIYDLAKGLADAGWRPVRFDFRGVGRSEGAYGHGKGELEDALAVFDALTGQASGVSPVVVGFSFGGGVAAALATRRRPARLVLVATPVELTMSDLVPLDDAGKLPSDLEVHVVVGTRDEFVPVEDAERLVAAVPGGASLDVLPDAGHFLEPSHNHRVVEVVLRRLGQPGRPLGTAS